MVGGQSLLASISIHAPREGGDNYILYDPRLADISIHAPREGGDVSPPSDCSKDAEFQSTPPVRGATAISSASKTTAFDFNPRPP